MGAKHIAARLSTPSPSAASSGGPNTNAALLERLPRNVRILTIAMGIFFAVGTILDMLGPTYFGWDEGCSRVGVIYQPILIGLGVILYRATRKVSPAKLLNLALVYAILLAFGVSYGEQAQPGDGGWSAVALLIVTFPIFLPSCPRRTVLTALGMCAAALVGQYVHELVSALPEKKWWRHAGNLGAVLFATIPAFTMQRMARVVSEARRLGSYQLVERIGAGGMGEVWRAAHRMLHRPAAIKLIRPDALGPEYSGGRVSERFEREAQATALLHSPHTIEVYDFGVTDDGSFFYVMELLDGLDLSSLVERHGPIPAARAVHLLRQACDSLEDAHHSGLIHRDVKPANLFREASGRVKVLDFGLAAVEGARVLTATGARFGTYAYMPPEQMHGQRLDPRADQYSLAVSAYFLASSRLPFDLTDQFRMNPEAFSRVLPGAPPALDAVFQRALSGFQDERYPTVRAFAQALQAALG